MNYNKESICEKLFKVIESEIWLLGYESYYTDNFIIRIENKYKNTQLLEIEIIYKNKKVLLHNFFNGSDYQYGFDNTQDVDLEKLLSVIEKETKKFI